MTAHGALIPGSAPFRIGAVAASADDAWTAVDVFNGKIGEVRVDRLSADGGSRPFIAAWHFGKSRPHDGLLLADVIDESSNHLHGACINAPTRAVTGLYFIGLVDDFRLAPDEYDAIHFHDDDITDAHWPVAFTFTVPNDLPSGVYAARLRTGGLEQHIPFFILPGRRKRDPSPCCSRPRRTSRTATTGSHSKPTALKSSWDTPRSLTPRT